jgi:hypothetical protein
MKEPRAAFFSMITLWVVPAMAGTFDGNWVGEIPPSGPCQGTATITVTVSGEALSGVVHNPSNEAPFKGSIDAEGNATFTTQKGAPGRIKFIGDHFDANWNSGGCQRHALGTRAPDATQIAALLAERKQAQATYEDLTARAAAGDRSVDFTTLRASYPFTKQWDANSSTSAPLMEQADVAVRGKDCASALLTLDEVLKIDYTMVVAHRLRSECLKGDAAHIESRIADGLMASLRRGGNGKTEATAYPVMTVHEENEILTDKHIVLKARDTEVRGSNGHFYDVVHGISVHGGLGVQNVYFDVTAMVNGRSSAKASTVP